MPTAVREGILDGMVTALRAIGSTTSYSSTVQPSVSRLKMPRPDWPLEPFIEIVTTGEDYDRIGSIGAAGTYDRTLHVEVLYGFTSANMDQDVSRAVHDVEYALRDWTVAGTTSDLGIQSYEVALMQETEPQVTVTFFIDVRYRTDDNAPATRV